MKPPLTYAEFYSKTFSNMKSDESVVREFVKCCPDGPILELGGGSGRTLGYIESRRHALLESDDQMLAILESFVINHSNATVIRGRCPPIPCASESFAGVLAAFGTIGEINPICATLQEIERVLIPGGCAQISAINPALFKSPPLGIHRTKLHGVEGFSVVSNTLPLPTLGPGEYQTQAWVRRAGTSQHFTVRQYFPTLEQWLRLINESGLELKNSREELELSQVFSFMLRKPVRQPAAVRSSIQAVYDSIGANYDQFISKAEYGLPLWINPRLENLRGLHPRVIDLACGNGYVGHLLSAKGIECSEVIGYDISAVMVAECRKAPTYCGAYRCDLSAGLPGITALSTDVVTAFGLFEFVPDPSLLLRDIRRILVLGGELLCSFEVTELALDEDRVEMQVGGRSISRYRRSEKSVTELLQKAGFTNIALERKQGYRSPTTGIAVNYLFVHADRSAL